MTRRILTALLALILAVVVGGGVSLALNATGNDRTAFVQDTKETVDTYAAIWQPVLSGGHNSDVAKILTHPQTLSDGLRIVSIGKNEPNVGVNWHVPAAVWESLAAGAERQNPADIYAVTATTSAWIVAAVPVLRNGTAPVVGVVLVARSTVPLDNQIRTLWLILGAIGIAAILAAAMIAVWLAQWVSKPLLVLDTAAGRLADGDLSIRAPAGDGPPELRRLARTFNTMAGRLEALVHGSRAVLADVSHQLRTPLAALRLRLDFLAADAAETDPEMAAELEGALDELTRLSRLVDGLLAVARAENVMPQPRVIDVAEAAAERVAAWSPVAEDRGITLAVEAPAEDTLEPVLGWLGEGHLEQILDNLIDNALDALETDGLVTVTADHTGSGVRITVADNGPGMSPEDRERAFLRFTTSSPGGTGLGLAIVHRLVTANGGTAKLTDTPGGGLTVLLDFPAAGNDASAAAGSPAASAGATRTL
jgi:signal transduction histidine kinase